MTKNSKEIAEKTVPFIIGPTGTGKSYLSLLVTQKTEVEIISADSRQLYKYMDIGTAKPDKEQLDSVPHHFIDFLRPDEYFSAGTYCKIARSVIRQVFSRNRIPLVVGGSGFYIRALIEGFSAIEVRDQKIRHSLRRRLIVEGISKLYQQLSDVDPELAQKLKPNDQQRILRGLEVYLSTGRRLSDLHEQPAEPADFKALKFGLRPDRKYLYDLINHRVDKMIESGLLIEVVNLQKMGYDRKLNALNTVGYKEVFDYLENRISYDEMIEKIKQNTRNYAKRQITWFKRDPSIKWFDINEHSDFLIIAGSIVNSIKAEL